MDWIKNIKLIEYLGIRRIEILKEPSKGTTAQFECGNCGCVFTVSPARRCTWQGKWIYRTTCPCCEEECEGEEVRETSSPS